MTWLPRFSIREDSAEDGADWGHFPDDDFWVDEPFLDLGNEPASDKSVPRTEPKNP